MSHAACFRHCPFGRSMGMQVNLFLLQRFIQNVVCQKEMRLNAAMGKCVNLRQNAAAWGKGDNL